MLSGAYEGADGDGRDGTSPADASEHVSTEAHADDGDWRLDPLPTPTAELFIAAGAIAAERLVEEDAAGPRIEEILRRVVDQCVVLSR